MKKFTFDAVAKDYKTEREKVMFPKLSKLGAWTDGVMFSTEWEPGDYAAFRMKEGKKYRVTIEEIN